MEIIFVVKNTKEEAVVVVERERERERERESNSLRNEAKIEAQCNCACLGYKDGLRYFVVCLFWVNLVHDTS